MPRRAQLGSEDTTSQVSSAADIFVAPPRRGAGMASAAATREVYRSMGGTGLEVPPQLKQCMQTTAESLLDVLMHAAADLPRATREGLYLLFWGRGGG